MLELWLSIDGTLVKVKGKKAGICDGVPPTAVKFDISQCPAKGTSIKDSDLV